WVWATYAHINPGPAQDHYRRRRDHGYRHAAALRHLFNKMLGQLHHRLQTRQTFDPIKAFGQPRTAPREADRSPRLPPRRRLATPVQQDARPAASPPANPPNLRPDQSLRTTTHRTPRGSGLTASGIGGLWIKIFR